MCVESQLEESLELRKHRESDEIRYHLKRAENFKLLYDPTLESQERHKPLAVHHLTIEHSADLIFGVADGGFDVGSNDSGEVG